MRWFLPISGCVGHKLAETFQMNLLSIENALKQLFLLAGDTLF